MTPPVEELREMLHQQLEHLGYRPEPKPLINPVVDPQLIRLGQISAEEYLREVMAMTPEELAVLCRAFGIVPKRGAEAILRNHCQRLASQTLNLAA